MSDGPTSNTPRLVCGHPNGCLRHDVSLSKGLKLDMYACEWCRDLKTMAALRGQLESAKKLIGGTGQEGFNKTFMTEAGCELPEDVVVKIEGKGRKLDRDA